MEIVQIDFLDIEENEKLVDIIKEVVNKCFEEEKLFSKKLYINVILTNPENIQKTNKEYRNIDNPTDVLSFPMFERGEVEKISGEYEDILGDIIISVQKVEEQAVEYGHSFERELAYMVVHGFYHLMGYDHMEEQEKVEMRKKEENILEKLNIVR